MRFRARSLNQRCPPTTPTRNIPARVDPTVRQRSPSVQLLTSARALTTLSSWLRGSQGITYRWMQRLVRERQAFVRRRN
jgi:hypothetical protein